jgi:hypothetical protein
VVTSIEAKEEESFFTSSKPVWLSSICKNGWFMQRQVFFVEGAKVGKKVWGYRGFALAFFNNRHVGKL